MNNNDTIFSQSKLPSTEVKEEMPKNTSELLSCQYCHLLETYNMVGTAFDSTLAVKDSGSWKKLVSILCFKNIF